ncbi:MAG: GNAT family N-acetyltransferase, partial [Acetobacteraceae bacterium]
MPDGTAALSLTLHARIADIPAPEWDGCAGDANPFVSHAFLSALEDSGSATARTGWLPQHAVLRDAAGGIVGVAPMYAKSHSYGEYVFDHGWAHAFERAGGAYYPKLQVGVPFSPVPGPRLLLRRAAGTAPPLAAMAAALEAACRQLDLSSVHVTFCNQAEWNALGAAGWLQRTGMQFHWQNDGYATFEDFLSALSSRKRKIIRRERRDAARGLRLRVLCGREIEPRHWQSFYAFYTSTVDRKWGSAYLTRRFFPLLAERLAERVVLMLAEQNGEPVAAALNLMGRDTLYGRNWGCRGEWP